MSAPFINQDIHVTPQTIRQVASNQASATTSDRTPGDPMDSQTARTRADPVFREEQQRRDFEMAWLAFKIGVGATLAQIAQLRALRLAKAAADETMSSR